MTIFSAKIHFSKCESLLHAFQSFISRCTFTQLHHLLIICQHFFRWIFRGKLMANIMGFSFTCDYDGMRAHLHFHSKLCSRPFRRNLCCHSPSMAVPHLQALLPSLTLPQYQNGSQEKTFCLEFLPILITLIYLQLALLSYHFKPDDEAGLVIRKTLFRQGYDYSSTHISISNVDLIIVMVSEYSHHHHKYFSDD